MLAECPRRRAVPDRAFPRGPGQVLDRSLEQSLFLRRVGDGRQILVNPAVDGDLMASRLHDGRDHFGVQERADGRNKERRRYVVTIQQRENPGQAGLGAEIGR